MKFLTTLALVLSLAVPAAAKCTDPCLSQWMDARDGKLHLAEGKPSKHFIKYTWRGWPAYDAMLCRKYGECESKATGGR